MADRPTPRLDVLIDRACRHLTPAESAALREEVAVLQQRATALDCMEREQRTRAERAEQQAANVRAECETWKTKAEEIERDRDRIATEHTEFVLKAGEQIGRAQADTELLRRTVRAECDAIEREQYGQHDEDADGMREAARRIRPALDAAGQADASGEEPPQHTARGTNAEDCPACRAAATPPPYPFLCPGPDGGPTSQRVREDGHTGACDATGPMGDPEPDETPTSRQAAAQDLEQWSAIINAEIDPDHAAQKLLALRDQDRATHDKWTRAVEQRNSRLRVELAQTRADVDHRDQSIRHLENGLRHERQALADARAHLNQVPNHHINSQVRADLKRRLEPAPADEVLPHELLRLLDMNRYVSTACDTAGACETAAGDQVDDADQLHDQAVRLHTRCRRTHKFTGAPCACECHRQSRP